ncbi:MAG TPA: mannosyltransferase family protein [Tenuifilaceae bacterium]|nr:mannosyltransferase family protein [Tenuifilaceae bacterium]
MKQLLHYFNQIKISEALRYSFKIWLSELLIFTILGAVTSYLYKPILPADLNYLWGTTPIDEGMEGALLGVWLRWDGIHYLRIADGGYSQEVLTAFFPLYPLLGRWMGFLVGSNLAGLLVVSRMAFLGALWVLYSLTELFFDTKTAKYAVIFLALFPTSVYLMSPYPMSLALFLSLAVIWFALRRKWAIVFLLGFMAGLTHGSTVPLVVGLCSIAIQKGLKDPRRVWLNLASASGPLLGTAMFLAWRINQGFPDFSTLQFQYWSRIMQPPWMIINDFIDYFRYYFGGLDSTINLVLFVGVILLTIWAYKRMPKVLWGYQLIMLLFLSSTRELDISFGSIGRFLLLMFPLPIELALLIKRPLINTFAKNKLK